MREREKERTRAKSWRTYGINSTIPLLRNYIRKAMNEYVAEIGSEVLLDAGAEIRLCATDSDEGHEGFEEIVDEEGVGNDVGHVGEELDELIENGCAVGKDLRGRWRDKERLDRLRRERCGGINGSSSDRSV